MMKQLVRLSAALLLVPLVPTTHVADAPTAANGRMEWFREAKFGMFIAWGLYSVPGGSWKGVR